MSKPTVTAVDDSIVTAVMEKFAARSLLGQRKYGTTLDRNDLSFLDWIQHSQEELMDAILYLEKMKKVLGGGAAAPSHSPQPSR
jgi:hypothetical protein